MRNRIRLNEGQLRRVIKESVKRTLNEAYGTPSQKDKESFANYANVDFYNGGMDDEDDYNSIAGILNKIYSHLVDVNELMYSIHDNPLVGDANNGSEKYINYLQKCIDRSFDCIHRIVNTNIMNRGMQPVQLGPDIKSRY